MDKTKIWIAGGIGAMGIGLIGTVIFMTTDIGKEPISSPSEPVEEVVTKTDTKDSADFIELTEDEEVERIMTSYTANISPLGYGDEEYPLEQAKTFKQKLLGYAEDGEVDTLLAEMEPKLAKYRFSEGTNLEIAGIYYDATVTKSLVGMSEPDMGKTLIGAYKTPEMMALMPLYLPELARRSIIRDNLSLTPLNEGPWTIGDYRYITSKEEADEDEVYDDNGVAVSMFNVVDGIHQIHVVEVHRDEEPDVRVRAYIAELANGKLELYGYYIPDETTHYYQTVAYFEEIDELYLKPNDEYQNERVQDELDSGTISKEALDAFLNPTE